jgi:signal transduction protein with GAF and PtsI domain
VIQNLFNRMRASWAQLFVIIAIGVATGTAALVPVPAQAAMTISAASRTSMANALLADQVLRHVDGFSIGSNDLTQLTLGVDRDSGVLDGFDERDEAVKLLMGLAIDAANKAGKYIGICGQAPSDFPELAKWLVRRGIRSVSLNPDSVVRTLQAIVEAEEQMEGQ